MKPPRLRYVILAGFAAGCIAAAGYAAVTGAPRSTEFCRHAANHYGACAPEDRRP